MVCSYRDRSNTIELMDDEIFEELENLNKIILPYKES
jgi:hypothetical protein